MSEKIARRRRTNAIFLIAVIIIGISTFTHLKDTQPPANNASTVIQPKANTATKSASQVLAKLPVKGRAPMTNYNRKLFGGSWASEGSCSMRDKILARDMTKETLKPHTCEVASGVLHDPYTGKTIRFRRGIGTSGAVQIDHVVAIGDAWQTGAQLLPLSIRKQLYNDPLELLAADGPANEQKGDSDAASWLPPNKDYRCRYVARQIAIKFKYHLWVTPAERDAMSRVLSRCPGQVLPIKS